jgi:hypothetical protein
MEENFKKQVEFLCLKKYIPITDCWQNNNGAFLSLKFNAVKKKWERKKWQ